MRRIFQIIAPALLALVLGLPASFAQQRPPAGAPKEKTLYERLGGYDAIAAIVDEVGSRFATDDQLRRFFRAHSKDSLTRQRQLAVDLICDLAGGPCYYIGRDLKTAHGGLGVSPSDWTRAMGLLGEVLIKVEVAERERKEFIALISSLEPQIVEK